MTDQEASRVALILAGMVMAVPLAMLVAGIVYLVACRINNKKKGQQ